MDGSRSKIPSKNLVRHRCAEGFNPGLKGLMLTVDSIKIKKTIDQLDY
jgi:hypothetical protein